jgi:hypothetical protein
MLPTPTISLTPTVARQTPRSDFGPVLREALVQAGQAAGALLGVIPGGGLLTAALGSVTAVASRALTASSSTGGAAVDPSGPLTGYVDQMRQEADRSLLMQLQMQQESREYNAVSNVLKVRHESARAAINNLR